MVLYVIVICQCGKNVKNIDIYVQTILLYNS
jgi:hypothetical protein